MLFDRLMAAGAPETPALETSARVYTYSDLADETARVAAALWTLGVRPGDRVAVQVEKSATNLILYLATVRAGAVYLPLNTAYTLTELAYFIEDAEPALIICDPAARDAVVARVGDREVLTLGSGGEGSLADLATNQSPVFETVARGREDLAAICYTSGTTGRSKGAMLTHLALTSNAATLVDLWRFTAADRLIHALPIYHVHGLFVATNVALMAGACLVLHPKFEPGAVIAAMNGATCLMGIPTFYTRLLTRPRPDAGRGFRDATVHQWFRAAARADSRGLDRENGRPNPRALRNDRNGDEHLKPL